MIFACALYVIASLNEVRKNVGTSYSAVIFTYMSALIELMEVLLSIAEHALKKLSVVLSKLLYLPCRPIQNAIFNPERMKFFLRNFAKISGMNCLIIYWFLVAVPILDSKKKSFDTYTHKYGTIVHFI